MKLLQKAKDKFAGTVEQRNLEKLIKRSDLLLITGTVAVNDSLDQIVEMTNDKTYLFYGTTISGIAELLGLRRYCFYGK